MPEAIEKMRNKIMSEKTKEKIRLANLGKKLSPEHIERIRSANLGRKASEETITKMKINHKGMLGKHLSKEHKEKLKITNFGNSHALGYKHTLEAIEKIRFASLGKKLSENTKRKIGLFHKGKKLSEESKEKLRNANLGKKYSEITRLKHKQYKPTDITKKKISLACLGRKCSEETIKKMKKNRALQVFPIKDTSIELKLQNKLTELGIPFKTHVPIMGQPDILIGKNICLFADGDYWHNTEKAKVRDKLVNQTLVDQGYLVIRIWEHEINNNLDECIDTIKPLFSTFFNKDKFQEVQTNGSA